MEQAKAKPCCSTTAPPLGAAITHPRIQQTATVWKVAAVVVVCVFLCVYVCVCLFVFVHVCVCVCVCVNKNVSLNVCLCVLNKGQQNMMLNNYPNPIPAS